MWPLVAQAVQLRPLVVVNVQILVLGDSEQRVIPQEANVSHRLLHLDLVEDLEAIPPVGDGYMTLAPRKTHLPPIRRVRHAVRPEARQRDVVRLPLRLLVDGGGDGVLREASGALDALGLEVTRLRWQQHLRLRRALLRLADLLLATLDRPLEQGLADALGGVGGAAGVAAGGCLVGGAPDGRGRGHGREGTRGRRGDQRHGEGGQAKVEQ